MGYQRRVHGELSLNTSAKHNPPFNMKFLVLSACLAVSSAALVTYPNGAVVPADTPEVALARAGQLGHALPVGYAGYPYAAYPYAAGYPHGLVAHANGAVVPVDEPAVYAAKVAHAAAGGVINPVGVHGYAYGYAGLVAHPNGAVVPVEPYEVVAARAAHLAAVAAAQEPSSLLIVFIGTKVQYDLRVLFKLN